MLKLHSTFNCKVPLIHWLKNNSKRKPSSVPVPKKFTKDHPEINSLLTLGEPIVDITSQINETFIQKYNLKLGAHVLVDEKENDYSKEVFQALESRPEVGYIPGGSAQNTIRVIAWCLNMEQARRKQFKVSMLGALGDDIYQKKITNSLKEIGVNPILQKIKGDSTSRCGVGVYKKEKLFISQLRASKRLSEEFIEENKDSIFCHQAVLIEGYMIKILFNICKKIVDVFKNQQKLIILSLSATFIVKFHYQKLIEIANDADIIAGNMEEAIELAEHKGKTIQDIFENIFKKLKPKDNRLLLVTDGPHGVYIGTFNYATQRIENFRTFYPPKVKDEDIQDLNGAGDAFLGGFLSQYMKGYSIEDCCKIGIDAATVVIKNVGCTFPKDTNLLYEN